MNSLLLALRILCAVPSPQDATGEWVEIQFYRVHLRNGNFIDGQLTKDVPLEVTLQMRSGQMVIKRDQIDRVEFIKMRSRNEAPVPMKPPIDDKTKKSGDKGRPKPPTENLAPEEIRKRVDGMIARVNAAKGEGKRFPIEEIQPLGDDAAVYLASRLRELPFDSQGPVVTALGSLKVSKTVPYLEECINDRNPKLRAIGAMGLGFMGDSYKVRYLRPLLKDPDPEVRAVDLSMLANVEEKDWFEPISELCSDPDQNVRTRALGLSNRLAKANNLGEQFMSVLSIAMRDANEQGKVDIANLTGSFGEKKGWEVLMRLLSESSPKVKSAAARGLMSLAADDSGPEVAMAMGRETEKMTRIYLAGASHKLHLKKAVPILVEWLGDQDEEIRKVAANSLTGITGQPLGMDRDKWAEWASKNPSFK